VYALIRFLRVLRYRKRYVFAAVAVAGILGALYYFTATRIYEAKASLLVTRVGGLTTRTGLSSNSEHMLPTYERILSSAVVVNGALSRLAKLSPDLRMDFADVPRDQWEKTLRDNLSAKAVRRTNMIELSYRSKSPEAATAVVQALVDSFLAFMEKHHKDVSIEVAEILDEERREVAGQLEKSQRQLLDTRRQVRDLGISGHETVVHPAVQAVITLSDSLVEVQKNRVQLEALLTAVQNSRRRNGDLRQHLATLEPMIGREFIMASLGLQPEIIQNVQQAQRDLFKHQADLSSLAEHYGPRHPKIVALRRTIDSLRAYVADHQRELSERANAIEKEQLGQMLTSLISQKLDQTRAHEAELAAEYKRAENETVGMHDRLAKLQLAEAEWKRLNRLHESLINRITSIDISDEAGQVRAAVVSEPHASDRPVSPKLLLTALLCLIAGGGCGAAIAYVLDLLDDRFQSPEDIQLQLGVPVLAMIRELPQTGESGSGAIQIESMRESAECEAFRTLRTALAFSGEQLDRIALTSSEPGDGKTTVTANLAAAYAQIGKKTLAIDGDLRRPGLTKLFEMRDRRGLSNVLMADGEVADLFSGCIHPSGINNLDIIPSGPRPSNPAELLSGLKLEQLISWADSQYDQVLIDCPPVLAASDAAILGRLADGMVVVVQPEKNHRRVIMRSVDALATMKINLLGVAANRIGNADSYYGYGGGYSYGYGTEDDDYIDDDFTHDDAQEQFPDESATVRRRAA